MVLIIHFAHVVMNHKVKSSAVSSASALACAEEFLKRFFLVPHDKTTITTFPSLNSWYLPAYLRISFSTVDNWYHFFLQLSSSKSSISQVLVRYILIAITIITSMQFGMHMLENSKLLCFTKVTSSSELCHTVMNYQKENFRVSCTKCISGSRCAVTVSTFFYPDLITCLYPKKLKVERKR